MFSPYDISFTDNREDQMPDLAQIDSPVAAGKKLGELSGRVKLLSSVVGAPSEYASTTG
tara:strand:+ start:10559 stop:10735 length:177 start_codon:yes stop_codon:yes gene_type:complete